MSESTTAVASSTSVYIASAFWEGLWRTSGIQCGWRRGRRAHLAGRHQLLG